jgi:hypothetical protein
MTIQTMKNPSNIARYPLLAAVLIVLLAVALRIFGTTDQSLWLDEGFTYNVIARAAQSWGAMFAEIAQDTHPPLYFVLLRLWVMAAGDSVLALRLFSGFEAILAVAVMFPLARRAGLAPVGVMVAALLLALWDADIFLAQETRMYAQRTLLACFSMWAYLHWLAKPTLRRAILWILANAAIVYTQYLGAYIPLVQGVHLTFITIYHVIRRGVPWDAPTQHAPTRQRFIAGVTALAAAGVIFLPWFVGVTLNQAATPPDYEMLNAPSSTWRTLMDLNRQYFGGQWALLFALMVWGNPYPQPFPPQGERGQSKSLSRRGRDLGRGVLWLWLVVPVALTFVANTRFPLLMPRNLSLITPAAALLVAAGIAALDRRARALILVAIVANALTSVDFYEVKAPFDDFGANVARYAQDGDVALMEVGNGGYPLQYYLDHLLPPSVVSLNLARARADDPRAADDQLDALLATTDTVWLAHWSPAVGIFDVLQTAGFQRSATLTVDHVGNALNTYRYDRVPSSAPLATFENGMVLVRGNPSPQPPPLKRRGGVFQVPLPQGEGFRDGYLDLLWHTETLMDADYTVSVFALDANGALLAQHDSYPLMGARPTSAWGVGDWVYDPHPLVWPAETVTLGVKVYTWWDSKVIFTTAGDEWVTLFP